jgi:hypothetical protein
VQIPNRELAFVPPEKISNYLISLNHPVGHSKAVFFRAAGYGEGNGEQLAQALIRIAQTGIVSEKIETVYGDKYIVPGDIASPSGANFSRNNSLDYRKRSNCSTLSDCLSQ